MSSLVLLGNKTLFQDFTLFFKFCCISTILLFSSASFSGSAQEDEVRLIVSQNVTELLSKYEEERQYYETDPDRFLKSMDTALSKIVDFRRIAARVMGKYGRKATKEQKNNFVEVFKKSLYNTYTRTLVESGVYEINVTGARINNRNAKKATVDLDVISENGTIFPVIYSMHKTKTDSWLLENVIVFGVNIGLAFRDRFEALVRKNKGNIDNVINTWTVDLDLKINKGA